MTTTLRALLGDNAPQIAKLAPELETRLGPFPDRPPVIAAGGAPPLLRRGRADPARAVAQVAACSSTSTISTGPMPAPSGSSDISCGTSRRSASSSPRRTARPISTGPTRSAKALVDWNRERLTTRIALRRFAVEETRAQLGALLGEDVSLEFAEAVQKETEGNPFFVEEVLKSLIEQGSVRREGGEWTRNEITELSIPQSMKAAIGNRLDRVQPGVQRDPPRRRRPGEDLRLREARDRRRRPR